MQRTTSMLIYSIPSIVWSERMVLIKIVIRGAKRKKKNKKGTGKKEKKISQRSSENKIKE